MNIIKRPRWSLDDNTITDEKVYNERRRIMKIGAVTAASTLIPLNAQAKNYPGKDLNFTKNSNFYELTPTAYDKITTYNNFYEFSLSKEAPAKLAHTLNPEPWTIEISGEVQKPMTIDMNDIISKYPLEERIYHFRCVEGWSMTVPWIGFELSYLLKKAGLTSKSHYVEFETKHDPKMFPEQANTSLFSNNIPFPYLEGLRIDEAMHPLTILSVGLYGKIMPKQNGAPIRLVVPWKYGFKSIKSITKIRVVEKEARSTWNKINPREYGFYANVNPEVDHPRWSQAKERVLGKFFKEKTEMFNGYGDEVASLYKNMNLRKFF
jgi:methionine sulfoxide reductase catalytic subunit